jgi:hypothetical protein
LDKAISKKAKVENKKTNKVEIVHKIATPAEPKKEPKRETKKKVIKGKRIINKYILIIIIKIKNLAF